MHLPVHLTCLYLAWCFFLSSPSNWLHTRQAIIGRKLCSIVGHVEANDGVLDCPPLLEKEKECTMVGCSISETREASNPKEERSRNSPLSVASVSGEKKQRGHDPIFQIGKAWPGHHSHTIFRIRLGQNKRYSLVIFWVKSWSSRSTSPKP